MIAASIVPKVRYRNENPPTDSTDRQTLCRYKIVKPSLTDGKKLRSLFTAHQNFVLRRDSEPLGRLFAITPEF
jgi:hypothetical protein